jgi:hypothetical protein
MITAGIDDVSEGVASAKVAYVDTRKISPSQFKKLVEVDKTQNKKYIDWLSKVFVAGNRNFDQLGVVNRFEELLNKNKIPVDKRDIGRYKSPEEVYDVVKHFEATSTKGEVEREIKSEEADVVFENDKAKVVRPKTARSSCIYGANTKWCTASTDYDNYFNDYYYSRGVNLYYVLTKVPVAKNFEKVAVSVSKGGRKEYFDAIDNVIPKKKAEQFLADLGIPIN